jgi:hypothetical protein
MRPARDRQAVEPWSRRDGSVAAPMSAAGGRIGGSRPGATEVSEFRSKTSSSDGGEQTSELID